MTATLQKLWQIALYEEDDVEENDENALELRRLQYAYLDRKKADSDCQYANFSFREKGTRYYVVPLDIIK